MQMSRREREREEQEVEVDPRSIFAAHRQIYLFLHTFSLYIFFILQFQEMVVAGIKETLFFFFLFAEKFVVLKKFGKIC